VRISVPASSANLGPGFDALALAVELRFHLDVGEPRSDDSVPLPDRHPASEAYRQAGGEGQLFAETKIPPGKGLGFSGAARVAGAAAASLARSGAVHHAELLEAVSAAEGHADNAAASVYGGFAVAAGGRSIRIAPPPLCFVAWIPDAETSTSSSRSRLPEQVSLADAVHNVGHASLLVAALATRDYDALRVACEDRLHQSARLAEQPESGAAIAAALAAGAHAAWLSGSGPTVGALTDPSEAVDLASELPDGGHTKVLELATFGIQAG